LIDLVAELLGDVFDARRFGEGALGLIIGVEQGRSGALFKVSGDKLALIVGRGIDQAGLDRVEMLWASSSHSLVAPLRCQGLDLGGAVLGRAPAMSTRARHS
jgi:hypothetical protein